MYFDRRIRELKVGFPKNEGVLLRAYLSELVSKIASGQADAHETRDKIHRSIINPLGHPEDLMPWCYFPWAGSKKEATEAIIAHAKFWIKNGADVFLSEYSKGLDVICLPDPVKAHQGGLSGQRYEWVFETKVHAIDKPVRIYQFGAFVWQSGRWVFAISTGESFSTLNTVSSGDLLDWKVSWYFKGAPPKGGRYVKGQLSLMDWMRSKCRLPDISIDWSE